LPGRFVDVGKSAARGDVAQLVLGHARTDIDESVVGVRGARTERQYRHEQSLSHEVTLVVIPHVEAAIPLTQSPGWCWLSCSGDRRGRRQARTESQVTAAAGAPLP